MKITRIKNIALIFIIGMVMWGFFNWQNNTIEVTSYFYHNPKISEAFNGYKIAQISDLHNKSFGKNQKNLLALLQNAKPNMIVITGDLVDSSNINAAFDFVEGATEIAPVYYVTGNHEYRLNHFDWNRFVKGMKQYGVMILGNKAINITKDSGDHFCLIGLSDISLSDHTLDTICSNIGSDDLKIVLAHEPQYFEDYIKSGADLFLTGHAHGGQVRIPFVGGVIAPNQGLFPKYTSGTYVKSYTTMIVNRGLGNSTIPIRIFNRPEIVLITLQAS